MGVKVHLTNYKEERGCSVASSNSLAKSKKRQKAIFISQRRLIAFAKAQIMDRTLSCSMTFPQNKKICKDQGPKMLAFKHVFV